MEALRDLHAGSYKRATFYFPKGDEAAVQDYLVIPDHREPGEIKDIHFKFCGQKLKKSAAFDEFVETAVPAQFKNRFSKSEKGIDIEICCDGLKLASASRLERLFLFTNDDDFIPFCRTIKEFGANISIIHLSETITRNSSLLREADSYDVVPRQHLQKIFLPLLDTPPDTGSASVTLPPPSILKPDTSPSDMVVESDKTPASSHSVEEGPIRKH